MENYTHNKLLTRKDVMNKLQCSGKTVRRMEMSGILPRVQLSQRCIRYEQKDIDKIIDKRKFK